MFQLLLHIDRGQSLCSRLINARHLYAIVVVEGSFDRHLEIFDMLFYPGEKSTSLIASFSFYYILFLVLAGIIGMQKKNPQSSHHPRNPIT